MFKAAKFRARRPIALVVLSAFPACLTSCGGGVITSTDVSPGEGVVIALIVIAAVLYVLAVGTRGK